MSSFKKDWLIHPAEAAAPELLSGQGQLSTPERESPECPPALRPLVVTRHCRIVAPCQRHFFRCPNQTQVALMTEAGLLPVYDMNPASVSHSGVRFLERI
ncbi:hypothetical protein [Noviherbaspirillum agri]